MTLPPPPDSFFEGGEPQSQVAPGETGRELLHETKNLAQAVALLGNVVKKQRQRQRQIIVTTLIAVVALALALAYTRYLSVQQTRDRLVSARAACVQDYQRGDVEIEILSASLAANATNPKAKAFFQPRIAKLQALQKNCDRLYPRPGEQGWPTYFG